MNSEPTKGTSVLAVDNGGSDNQKKLDLLKFILQLFHLVLAAALFLIGIVEFSVEPSVFDVFGKGNFYLKVGAFLSTQRGSGLE